jgi:hypothetical protein
MRCPNLLFIALSKKLKDLIKVKLSLAIIVKLWAMKTLSLTWALDGGE